MMQESPRLPPMLNPGWTPSTIPNNSVDAGRRGTGKRARGTGILNGHHHGKPSSSVHPHLHQQQQNTQDALHPQSQVPSPALPPPPTSPQQPSSIPPQSPMSLRDTPKLQATPKRASGAVSVSSSPEGSSHTIQAKGKEIWGGWLGTSLGSQRSLGEASKHRSSSTTGSSPLHSSEHRTSGYDMTKLYPELSAKLGLTKPTSISENTSSSHKNGITLKEHFNSGCLKKLEHVTDDSRIKIISTGQIVSNAKGILAAKIGNGLQPNKSSSSKSYKQKHKSSDRGPRKDGHSRLSSMRPDSNSDRGSKKDGHSRVRSESSDKSSRKDGHSRSSSGRSECGDRSGSRKDHSRASGRSELVSSGTLHTSAHSLSRSPHKGPSSFSSRSTGVDVIDKKSKNSINVPSSILEEQLRGGPSPRQMLGLSSPATLSSPLHNARLPEVGLPKPVGASAPVAISSALSCPSRSLVMPPATYPPSVAAHQARVVTLPPRRVPQLPINHTTAASLPESLLRVHTLREKYYAYSSDLFPLGIETSEESDISDVDDMCGSQQGWVDPTGDDVWDTTQSLVNLSPTDLSQPSSGSNCQRSVILASALASYRRQVEASRLRSEVRAWEVDRKCSLTHSLVEAARTHPRLTADACSVYHTQCNQESPKAKHRLKSSVLVHRTCAYDDGEGKGECGEHSLPGTRHCLRHIMYNVDQLIFTHCTARLSDNTLCRVPVFDMSHELPLCVEHSKKKDVYIRSTPEETPKPKRPRKKNKMPILSRYGKRSKKRRRSSNSTSSIIPSTCVRPPMASQSSLSSPQPSPSTPQTSPHFSTTSCTDSLAEAEESELEDDMEGMVLDAASRLLDPRDLQDVLNRIPDHELTQLFDAPEGKSGEFDGNSDEKEEMESQREEDRDRIRRDCSSQSVRPVPAISALVTASTTTVTTSSTPPLAEEGSTLSLDESTLNELVAGNIPIDSIISSSFNQQELNTISQALSNIVQENNINLAGFDLSASNSFSASEVGSCAVVDVSDSSVMSQTSEATGQTDFSESETTPIAECKGNVSNQRPRLITDTAALSPLK